VRGCFWPRKSVHGTHTPLGPAYVGGSGPRYLGVGLFVATRLSTPVHQPTEQTPADEGFDFQEVGFESTDGLDLRGWWVPGDGSYRAE
jgi:hypothetical protein